MDREFLKRWSVEWVAAHDPDRDRLLDDEVRAGWLGFEPAAEADVVAAERRLGCRLPPSLRSFLLITDGWKDAGVFIYRLAGAGELAWLRDTEDRFWADSWEGEESAMMGRALRLSLDGDASILLLDPRDVGPDGEWAAYELSSWSGMGPERHDSFDDLMRHLYAGFHALRQPPGETRDGWDAEVERARLLALDGEPDEADRILAEAQEFGRERARLLRFQLHVMRGDWYTVPLSALVSIDAELLDDPVFTQIMPLVYAEPRYTSGGDDHVAQRFRQHPDTRELINSLGGQGNGGTERCYGNPEFDAAVTSVVAGLEADVAAQEAAPPGTDTSPNPTNGVLVVAVTPRNQADRRPPRPTPSTTARDVAWRELSKAMRLWRPVSPNHIAPIALLTEPLLRAVITPSRGRELLRIPRAG